MGKRAREPSLNHLKKGNPRRKGVCCRQGSFVNYMKKEGYLAIFTSAKDGVEVLWNDLMHLLNMKEQSVHPPPHRCTLHHKNNSQPFTTLVNHYLINFSLKKQKNPKLWKITFDFGAYIMTSRIDHFSSTIHYLHKIFSTKSRHTCSMFVMRCICSNISSLVV